MVNNIIISYTISSIYLSVYFSTSFVPYTLLGPQRYGRDPWWKVLEVYNTRSSRDLGHEIPKNTSEVTYPN